MGGREGAVAEKTKKQNGCRLAGWLCQDGKVQNEIK